MLPNLNRLEATRKIEIRDFPHIPQSGFLQRDQDLTLLTTRFSQFRRWGSREGQKVLSAELAEAPSSVDISHKEKPELTICFRRGVEVNENRQYIPYLTMRRLIDSLNSQNVEFTLVQDVNEPYQKEMKSKEVDNTVQGYGVRLKHGDPGVQQFLNSEKALELIPAEAVELFQKPAAEIYMRSYEQAERARGRLGTT